MPSVIVVTVFSVITPDMKDKRGNLTIGIKPQSSEVSKATKYQELCRAVGMSFLLVVFEFPSWEDNDFWSILTNCLFEGPMRFGPQ